MLVALKRIGLTENYLLTIRCVTFHKILKTFMQKFNIVVILSKFGFI